MRAIEMTQLLDKCAIPYVRVIAEKDSEIVLDVEDRELSRNANRGRVAAANTLLRRQGLKSSRKGFRITVNA
jgi:hypothetical protein